MSTILTAIDNSLPASEQWEKTKKAIKQAKSLRELVTAVLQAVWFVGQQILQAELEQRGSQPQANPLCEHCGTRLVSKGKRPRQIQTLLGVIHWQRRVLRCPHGCPESQRVPSDEQLGIAPYERTSWELKYLGCLLSIFVPYEIACYLLEKFTGIELCAGSLWNWVQEFGQRAEVIVQERLAALEAGEEVALEAMDAQLQALTMAMGSDGVMVPFRPQTGTAKGKIQFREVKIAVIARLQQVKSAAGKLYTRLCQRRVVAVLGSLDQFKAQLMWEALHQGLHQAPQVVWLSDGGVGFWRVYRECFAQVAVGVLDFYHAVAHLARAAQAWLADDPETAQVCFERWRHLLRHGRHTQVLRELTRLVNTLNLSKKSQEILVQVQAYFQTHLSHVAYAQFEQQGLPLGSGMVESACKWLIQQRFKGVGMRWSEKGFEHLLYLRLAWVNQRFDSLFQVESLNSPNP